jgi:hypothetical protein
MTSQPDHHQPHPNQPRRNRRRPDQSERHHTRRRARHQVSDPARPSHRHITRHRDTPPPDARREPDRFPATHHDHLPINGRWRHPAWDRPSSARQNQQFSTHPLPSASINPADPAAASRTRVRRHGGRERLDWVFDLATTVCRRVIAVALLACLATLTWLGAVTMFNLATTRAAAPATAGAPTGGGVGGSPPSGPRAVVGHLALAAHTTPLPSSAATRCVSAADAGPGVRVAAGPVDLRLGALDTPTGCGLGLAARDSDGKHDSKHNNSDKKRDKSRDKGRGGGQDWYCLCRDRDGAPAGWSPWGPAGWTDRAGRTGWPSGWPTTGTGSGWPWAPTTDWQPNAYGYGGAGSGAVCRPVQPGQARELPGGALICAPANPSVGYTSTGW